MDKQSLLILSYFVAAIGVLFFIELSAPIPYIYQVGLKVVLFLLPVFWVGVGFFEKPDLRKTKLSIWLGIAVLVLILAAYWVLRGFIDLEKIERMLAERQRITREIYIFVAIYAILGNSILEEVFFRGIVVQKLNYRPWVISSALFSFYHLTIFISWFSWWVLLIALVSLFVGGLLFCWLNGARRSIWNSWLMHVFADIAIFSIGFLIYF